MSSPEGIRAWRATRLPLAVYAPFALLLALAAAGGMLVTQRGLATAALAFGLVAQFRLWDDLVDRARDRRLHPQRVLARARSAVPFRCLAIALGIGNALALAALNGPSHGLGAAALHAVIACWYRWHARRDGVHERVLLLKYPAFVLLLAPAGTWPWPAAALVYAAMLAYEWLDTAEGAATARSRPTRYLPFVGAALVLVVLNLGVHA